MKFYRFPPVIGQPVSPEEERALRNELFVARWKPRAEALEKWTTPIAVAGSIGLLVMMLVRVIIAVVEHAPAVLP